ncbi:MAG TPA: Rne/Rng family ribonuclease [Pyrinomonadaceae bacterium]|jgi:ribonuclease G|nr:Rne/Rng family ribonuclease [Pyrinomonadaceae bacterium]
MPKEMIVSVNGREKKIAIVEDGRVTEFYIERGEGGQGIVGNIYKGRVMRVLPGMQSAFVDIGLERDAFLYVTDFFDEEEEFERIVVDKKKTDGADDDTAARAAAERIERARIERERRMEEAQEEATTGDEPEEAEPAVAEPEAGVEEELETAEAAPVPAPAAEVEAEAETGGRRGRDRRRRRRGERGGEEATPPSSTGEVPPGVTFEEGEATPFVAAADSFERIVDDEAGDDVGTMLKDARLQERLTDQTRAVEFDMEPTTPAEVGSLLGGGADAAAGFERVSDDEDESAPATLQSVQPEVAASVGELIEVETGEDTFAAPASFERVSDDEGAAEPAASKKAAKKGSKKAAKKGAAGAAASTAGAETPAAEEGAEESAGASKRGSKKGASKAPASKKAASKEPAASKKGASKGASKKRGSKKAGAEGGDEAGLEDAEASVSSRGPRGEFARRGGRRRRRRPGEGEAQGNGHEGDNGEAEVLTEDVSDEPESEVVGEAAPVEPPPPVQPPQQPSAREREASPSREGGRERGPREGGRDRDRGRGRDNGRSRDEGRGDRDRTRGEHREARGGGEQREQRGGGEQRGGEQREQREQRGGGRDRDAGRGRRGQPTITDLLREGQEIIVQIAKEPISQKGARITSHIALPGRFLVYMPTIEHVGVSRKIESDSERSRLRKLIQAIVKEEDVPSGGFIVRTAGVGISEADLRDDARYLVRTWRDIRKSAERTKPASIVHKDLDLVQRLLRDQLSDDFEAIRVDSEQEYQEIVEFVNRIQPRLVNRVKLYTREEPILETYGVQAEIDKAIKPRVWLKSGGYLVINQTEALVAIDVNTGKYVGRGGSRLEDTITRTNLEAVDEIARQIRLRDLGGILVLDLIDMEERRNRARVLQALQDALRNDKSPTKVLSFNDFGLVIMTRKRVKQSLERTLCSPCPYCTGAGLVKSPQTVCYEILEESRRLARAHDGEPIKQATLRVHPEVARALRSTERDVLTEIEDYLHPLDLTSDEHVHQEQFDFAFV